MHRLHGTLIFRWDESSIIIVIATDQSACLLQTTYVILTNQQV